MKKSLFLMLGVLGAASVALAQAPDGAALFKAKMCGMCHGAGKPGGDLKGIALSEADIVKVMKDPKSVKADAKMKPANVTDAEAKAIAHYVKTGL